MAKKFDAQAEAIQVKRGFKQMADVPEKYRADVRAQMNGRNEMKMIQRMRAEAKPDKFFHGTPVRERNVRIA